MSTREARRLRERCALLERLRDLLREECPAHCLDDEDDLSSVVITLAGALEA